jgi:hypothetical protein
MLVDCDFTQTNLAGCALFEAELRTIRFPKWPNVTFLEPGQHKSELQALRFPPAIQVWWDIVASGFHVKYSSETYNWDHYVKDAREAEFLPYDPEPYRDEFRSVLATLPYVII